LKFYEQDNFLLELSEKNNRLNIFNKICNECRLIAQRYQDIGLKYIELPLNITKYKLQLKIPNLYLSIKNRNNNLLTWFLAAQHNEYNGTFGILDFFLSSENEVRQELKDYLNITNGALLFTIIGNPVGFLFPSKENKYGYFAQIHSQVNMNRYWDKILLPSKLKRNQKFISKINLTIGSFLNSLIKFNNQSNSTIIAIDFHETSLIVKDLQEIKNNFSQKLILDDWVKKFIIFALLKEFKLEYNEIKLFDNEINIPEKNKSDILPNIDLNKPIKMMEIVPKNLYNYEDMKKYLNKFYKSICQEGYYFFCYGNKIGLDLSHYLSKRLKEDYFPSELFKDQNTFFLPYKKIGHLSRTSYYNPNLHAIEIEMSKIFYNLEEIYMKLKRNINYKMKLNSIFKRNYNITKDSIRYSLNFCSEKLNTE